MWNKSRHIQKYVFTLIEQKHTAVSTPRRRTRTWAERRSSSGCSPLMSFSQRWRNTFGVFIRSHWKHPSLSVLGPMLKRLPSFGPEERTQPPYEVESSPTETVYFCVKYTSSASRPPHAVNPPEDPVTPKPIITWSHHCRRHEDGAKWPDMNSESPRTRNKKKSEGKIMRWAPVHQPSSSPIRPPSPRGVSFKRLLPVSRESLKRALSKL